MCFVVGAGVPGVDTDGAGQGGGGVIRDDTEGVGDQLGLDVQDCWPGLTWASGMVAMSSRTCRQANNPEMIEGGRDQAAGGDLDL